MGSIRQIRRLLRLLEHLQSGRRYNTSDLSNFLDVSKRTIFRDLKVLKDSGIELMHDETEQGYWIPPSTYLQLTRLTPDETLSLLLLGKKLGQHKTGIPFYTAARDAWIKLMGNLSPPMQNQLSDLANHLHISADPSFHSHESKEKYLLLLESINKRHKIRLLYHSLPEQEHINTLVSPYFVLFKHHNWYIIGRSSFHRDVRTFHINRIIRATLTTDAYKIPPRFSLNKYFGNAWHVDHTEPEIDVVIRFEQPVANIIAEMSWHPTQRLQWNEDGSLHFHSRVAGIREISQWILGYGETAEVLEPPSLRDSIRSCAQKMLMKYHVATVPHERHAANKTVVK